MSEKEKKPPRFIVPPNALKEKIGEGGIPADRLTKAQTYIRENKVDFSPEGKRHLATISELIAQGKQITNDKSGAPLCEKMISEVMQLKAHGGMFHYGLISLISDVVLQFLEKTKTINADIIAILIAYSNTIDVILENQMRGDGGEEGLSLAWELEQATQRYFKKHAA